MLTVAAFALGVVVAGLVTRALVAPASSTPRRVVQFELNPAPMPAAILLEGFANRFFAVSPDGTAVVYAGRRGGAWRLFVRSMATGDMRELGGTERAMYPFWSPDAAWIGFVREGQLEKVPLEGGSPIPIAQVGRRRLSATWGENDQIVFAQWNALFRVSAVGGTPEAVFETADVLLDDVELLPGGNAALVSAGTFFQNRGDSTRTDLAAVVFGDGELRVLIEHAHTPRFLPSGHLVYATDDALWAVRFDPEQLAVHGEPVRVRDNVRANEEFTMAEFDLARDGTLVYISADLGQRDRRRLTWVDRAGRRDAAVPQVAEFAYPRLSRDGRAIAVSHGDDSISGSREIWIHDVGGRPPRRLVSGNKPGLPTFSPDGRTVYFVSHEFDEGRGPNLYAIASDGSQTQPTPLLREPYYSRHPSVSPDGRELLFYGNPDPKTQWDILALLLGEHGAPRAVVQSPGAEGQAEFSPDGRWIAYASDQEGSAEVYAQPYPHGAAQRISPLGGSDPVWSRSGDELFYRDGNALMAVAVGRDGPDLTFGSPQRLFELDGWPTSIRGHSYDVAPDGRFLLVEMDPAASGGRGRLTAVVNWGDELKRLVP